MKNFLLGFAVLSLLSTGPVTAHADELSEARGNVEQAKADRKAYKAEKKQAKKDKKEAKKAYRKAKRNGDAAGMARAQEDLAEAKARKQAAKELKKEAKQDVKDARAERREAKRDHRDEMKEAKKEAKAAAKAKEEELKRQARLELMEKVKARLSAEKVANGTTPAEEGVLVPRGANCWTAGNGHDVCRNPDGAVAAKKDYCASTGKGTSDCGSSPQATPVSQPANSAEAGPVSSSGGTSGSVGE